MRIINSNISKRAMALLLSAIMVLGMLPLSLFTVFAATTEEPESFTVSVKDVEGNPLTGGSVVLSARNNSWGLYMEEDIGPDGIAVFDSALIENEYQTAIEAGTLVDTALATVYGKVSGYTYGDVDISFSHLTDGTFIQHIDLTLEKKITDVTITGNTLTYTGEEQELVSVTEVDGDTVTYIVDGGEPTTTVPTATDVCSKSIKVTVSRTGHVDLVKTVTAKIEPGTLSDIDITAKTDLKYNEEEQELVTLTGDLLDTDTVTWELNGASTESRDIPKADAIGTHTVKLTVERANYVKFEKEVSVDISYGVLNLDSLKIEANDRTYDTTTQDAVTVTGQGNYDLEYKLEEDGQATNTIPQITEAGNYTVYVTAKKTGYTDKTYPTYPISVTIQKAKIEGVTATGYSAKYDKQTHNAITEVKGTADGDVVTYSNSLNGPYSDTIPTVKGVKSSGTYYVKVERNDNYEILYIPVTVSITRNDQQVLSFGETPNLTYNESNTFKYEATTNASDADGDIDYEKVGGTADFTVAADGTVTYTSVGTIKVKATISSCDNYEGDDVTYEITVSYVDVPAWTITPEVTTVNNCKWYDGNVVIKADGYQIIKGSNALGQTTWATDITESDEKDYPEYKVAFKDQAGNVTDLVEVPYFAIDTTAPTEKNEIRVEFKDKYTDTLSKVINFLSFGLFCNEEVEVTVTCDDTALTAGSPNSGIASIELYKYDINGNPTAVAPDDENVPNVFTLPIGFEGTIKVKVTDKVGNTLGEQLITTGNSNMANSDGGYIMIEGDAPVLSELKDEPIAGVRQDEGTHKYSGDVKVTFDAQDTGSGLYSVTVKLNGDDYPVTPTTFAAQDRAKHSYELSTVGKTPDEDGKYKFDVTVVDNAGFEVTDTITVEKDLTAAKITGFDFSVADGDVDVQDVVSIEDYGYYFKDEVTVTVSAKDEKFNAQDHELVSGVEKITVVLVDKDGKYYTVDNNKKVVAITDITGAVTHNATDNSFEFKITEDFKGQIYAYATDNVGNTPVNSTFDFGTTDDNIVDDGDLKGYKHPAGSVLESQNKHDNADYDHITFTKDGTTFKTNDESDNELYAGNVDVKLTVTDNYSGIAKIEWSVVAPYDVANNQEGQTTIANNENVNVGGKIGDWTVLTKDVNLVTKVEQTITVKNDSNNIAVWVRLTDRAGNTTEETIKFNIDKQAPIMTVEMNDNDDAENNGFFKDARTYKVTILERNFINENVKFVVTSVDNNDKETEVKVEPQFKLVMDGDSPKVSVDENGIEFYTYEWNSEFKDDGDYKFSVSAVDLAEHKTEDDKVAYVNDENEDIRSISNAFTVDNLDPTITVAYDNNSAQNDKFFKNDRTATITIVEHNFDVDRVDFVRNSVLDTKEFDDPAIKWEHKGNTHIATIVYNADGDYTFDVTMKDMAGRESGAANYGDTVAGKEFTVDKTIVKPSITGVENGKAYPDDVIPVITLNDVNFAEYEAVLTRTRKGEKNVDVTDKFINKITTDAKGGSATNDKFEKIADNDGIYTLKVTMKDKAGNSEEQIVTFTVNRFGSVYDFGEYLTKLIANGGAFEQKITEDIVLTEYNPDRLVADSLVIEITRDGKPVEDVKFNVSPVINDQVAIGESGWFQYAYTINKENFAADGVYKIAISSKDATGNTPENSNYEDKNILFRVDSTTPEITSITGLEEDIINAQEVTVKYTIFDAIGLKSITVFVDGKKVGDAITDFKGDANNYSGEFVLKEASSAQKVRILVEDLAGNITDTDSEDFESAYEFNNSVTVSTNIFVRWYANKGLFWGSIAGVVVLAGVLAFFIARRKKKED